MRGSHDALLEVENLLERLTELRKTVSILDYYFVIKGYNSGTASGRDEWARVWGKGHRTSMTSPGTPSSQHLHVFTNPEAWLLKKPFS